MEASVREELLAIPTYKVGEPDKNPLFLENRVYQGSSGKVYPYPVIDKIYDTKTLTEYKAVILENEYLQITFLPQLGGRIYRAVDKTNDYDFVYYNPVIKPALVGLLGPWISGGIEFNWPQHHRPTTYMPVAYKLETLPDGGAQVVMSETDRMYGTSSTARFILRPGRAYLEIDVKLFNPTPFPQTFLWWANPALEAGEHTRSVFPPDVQAVYDHGKRDVSAFPIARGTYYKVDYSAGVDISRYKNIPVPTSYMACASRYDFVGGYDEEKGCGMLHVADRHISPGKKQWTWGCGDFGRAWDRNLSEDGRPYVELMTGVYTDNQPDFTWLKPFEEKRFTQYFMPYKTIGAVKNASKEVLLACEYEDGAFQVGVYVTGPAEGLTVALWDGERQVYSQTLSSLTPEKAFLVRWEYPDRPVEATVTDREGRLLLAYRHTGEREEEPTPAPLQAPALPVDTQSLEELYFTGMHLEQYRHPTYRPEDYYLEGLRRDACDSRLNIAYGRLLLRRGAFAESKPYLERALKRMTRLNGTPYDAEVFYLLGQAHFYLGELDDAYDRFRKGSWDRSQAGACAYFAALVKARQGDRAAALAHAEEALTACPQNRRALGLKASLLGLLGREEERAACIEKGLSADPFDGRLCHELFLQTGEGQGAPDTEQARLETAAGYMECGMYDTAAALLEKGPAAPLPLYYLGYCKRRLGDAAGGLACYRRAEAADSAYCFPHTLADRLVLEDCLSVLPAAPMASYYLGLLLYDKRQYDQARDCFRSTVQSLPGFAAAHRTLALYACNKARDGAAALLELETAFRLDPKDGRVLLELDQLRKKCNLPPETRLAFLEAHRETVEERDDLYTEYVTLLNLTGETAKALSLMENRKFHPWEGGEGKITSQYVFSLFRLAAAAAEQEPGKALALLERARRYPENLGEGKLQGARDTHLDYLSGVACRRLGEEERAQAFFRRAAADTFTVGGVMYYNDQPADLLFFKGLALKALGETAQAAACFDRLIAYGQAHRADRVTMDYFAVSLPDFLTFDDDLTLRSQINCLYLSALGYMGRGETGESRRLFDRLKRLDAGHIGAAMYGDILQYCPPQG